MQFQCSAVGFFWNQKSAFYLAVSGQQEVTFWNGIYYECGRHINYFILFALWNLSSLVSFIFFHFPTVLTNPQKGHFTQWLLSPIFVLTLNITSVTRSFLTFNNPICFLSSMKQIIHTSVQINHEWALTLLYCAYFL